MISCEIDNDDQSTFSGLDIDMFNSIASVSSLLFQSVFIEMWIISGSRLGLIRLLIQMHWIFRLNGRFSVNWRVFRLFRRTHNRFKARNRWVWVFVPHVEHRNFSDLRSNEWLLVSSKSKFSFFYVLCFLFNWILLNNFQVLSQEVCLYVSLTAFGIGIIMYYLE